MDQLPFSFFVATLRQSIGSDQRFRVYRSECTPTGYRFLVRYRNQPLSLEALDIVLGLTEDSLRIRVEDASSKGAVGQHVDISFINSPPYHEASLANGAVAVKGAFRKFVDMNPTHGLAVEIAYFLKGFES